jgi:putative SOS response-associated peptidase YedK
MCGRFTLYTPLGEIVSRFAVEVVPAELRPRYNLAPTQDIAVITVNSPRTLRQMRWGLVPSWAKDLSIGSKMINARAETLLEKPSFRTAVRRRRCLIPAEGFYEWKQTGGRKQPMYIHLKSGAPFAFAGLWEEWRSPEGEVIRSCSIVTVEPNELMATIHNRMPSILQNEVEEAIWLEGGVEEAMSLLRPYPSEAMEAYPISTRVNSPAVDIPACILPAPPIT